VVAKVEWHNGELFPRVGFIVTNLVRPAKRVVRFYNQRGTAEQWIKEGKNAIKWTRLSCHDFVDRGILETTEELSSHPGETGHASQKKHRNTPGAREKSRANQKKALPICGAGRESQKRPTRVVGWKPYGKCQPI
jgi:hypothetical protein